jgi:hypothetical protein
VSGQVSAALAFVRTRHHLPAAGFGKLQPPYTDSMSSLYVVVDTRTDPRSRRVGLVCEPSAEAAFAPVVTVLWPDGTEEEVKLSKSFRKLRRDSLDALVEFAPDSFRDPTNISPTLFARALASTSKSPLNSAEILKLVLEKTGLDRAVVDAAWKQWRHEFEAMPEIKTGGQPSKITYRLVGQLPLVDINGTVNHQLPAGVETTFGDEADNSENSKPALGARNPIDQSVTSTQSGMRGRIQRSERREGAAEPVSSSLDSAREKWAREPSTRLDWDELEGSPLAASIMLDEYSSKGWLTPNELSNLPAEAIPAIQAQRKSVEIDEQLVQAWFASSKPLESVADGATELEKLRGDPEVHSALVSRYSTLVGRVLKGNAGPISPAALARAFVALRRSKAEPERRRGLEALGSLISVLDDPQDLLSKIDRGAFFDALAELPFTNGGEKALLIAQIARVDRSLAAESGWWRGFRWHNVGEVASGPLSSLIVDSELLTEMVHAVADAFASGVSTRRALAELLGAPRFAVEHIEPPTVVALFSRVAESDSLFASWSLLVTGQSERAALAAQVEDAKGDKARALESEGRVVAEMNDLRDYLAATQVQLESLQSEAVGLSERERRQVKIDTARVVAQMAATVEQASEERAANSLFRKVNTLAERFGLRLDAERGTSVAFNPARHSSPGIRPHDGEVVNVARAGYTWFDGNDELVIIPALVTRISGSEESA